MPIEQLDGRVGSTEPTLSSVRSAKATKTSEQRRWLKRRIYEWCDKTTAPQERSEWDERRAKQERRTKEGRTERSTESKWGTERTAESKRRTRKHGTPQVLPPIM